jgi:hypothetical protein
MHHRGYADALGSVKGPDAFNQPRGNLTALSYRNLAREVTTSISMHLVSFRKERLPSGIALW